MTKSSDMSAWCSHSSAFARHLLSDHPSFSEIAPKIRSVQLTPATARRAQQIFAVSPDRVDKALSPRIQRLVSGTLRPAHSSAFEVKTAKTWQSSPPPAVPARFVQQ